MRIFSPEYMAEIGAAALKQVTELDVTMDICERDLLDTLSNDWKLYNEGKAAIYR